MLSALDPFRFLLIAVAGWMNQHQLLVIDYLREENRILREQLGGRRLRFTDGQRRRLAAKAKGLGRKLLAEIATVVTPETLVWPENSIYLKQPGIPLASLIMRRLDVKGPGPFPLSADLPGGLDEAAPVERN